MPPFIPQKRIAISPPPDEKAAPQKKSRDPDVPSNFSTKARKAPEESNKKLWSLDSDDSDSSLSSVDSTEFQDAIPKATDDKSVSIVQAQAADDGSDESDDDVEWENAIHHEPEQYIPRQPAQVTGDIEFSIDADDDDFGGFAATSGKKKQGLSKIERETRMTSHQLHVQFLLWHNAIRNSWVSDATVQKTLMDQLPSQIRNEVDKWKRASGIEPAGSKKFKAKKQKDSKGKPANVRDERDWGRPSQRLEAGKADLSSGDPLISLLKVLSAYWNKRFAITEPGLRKGATALVWSAEKKSTPSRTVLMTLKSMENEYVVSENSATLPKNARAREIQKAQAIDLSSGSDDSEGDSVVDITPSLPKKRSARYDREVPYPIYWTEAISPITSKVYPVSPLVLDKAVASNDEMLSNFEPRGAKADKVRLVMAYVVAYSSDRTAKDVTVRYLRKHIWPGKTKAFRVPVEKIPVYSKRGKVSRYEDYDWFKHTLSPYVRSDNMRTAVDDVEDANELVPQELEKKEIDDTVDTLASLKASPDFVLERFLRREEALRPGAIPDRMFLSGKRDNLKEEAVYHRSDVERCLTTESWHKEGRIPRLGEVPLKRVPVRAVTLTRKREAEEHERITGQKQLQGLYSWDQTEYIIPPPIQDGVIPKNSFGNIDAFVPTMIPKGAVHIPQGGTVRVCKKLEIDFAEAVVGFEFGNKRAVPVIKGVVVAKENEKNVREAWKKWSEEQKKKEEMKVEKLVLDLWRKFTVGLRIRKRVQEQYGEDINMAESAEVPTNLHMGSSKDEPIDLDGKDDSMGGGFFPDAPAEAASSSTGTGGGFFLDHSDDERSVHGELILEDHNEDKQISNSWKGKQREEFDIAQYPTPVTTELTLRDEPRDVASTDGGTELQEAIELPNTVSDSVPDDNGASNSPSSNSESGANDEYNPMAGRRSLRTPATKARRTSGRVARSKEQTTKETPAPQQGKGRTNIEVVVPNRRANRTPNKKVQVTKVTSPYFDQPSTGRLRRSKK